MIKDWVFVLNSRLEPNEVSTFEANLAGILDNWKTHGHQLNASCKIYFNQIIQILLDDNSVIASGCSIDSLSKEIMRLAASYDKSILDSNMVAFINDKNEVLLSKRSDIQQLKKRGEIGSNSLVLDLSTQSSVFSDKLVPLENSWVKNI